ncbi:MAG: C40 family peptidase [Pseudomonadota bacterium]
MRAIVLKTTIGCLLLGLAGCSGMGSRGDLSAARQDVVMAAIAQVGTPYRYGGGSPGEGFDCSGLVQYSHGIAGLRVPRDTRGQMKSSRSIRPSRARPGDLVFFKTGWRRYHVGIVVEKERFVHAPRGGKSVRLSRLDSAYWRRHLTGAGTFLN